MASWDTVLSRVEVTTTSTFDLQNVISLSLFLKGLRHQPISKLLTETVTNHEFPFALLHIVEHTGHTTADDRLTLTPCKCVNSEWQEKLEAVATHTGNNPLYVLLDSLSSVTLKESSKLLESCKDSDIDPEMRAVHICCVLLHNMFSL